MRGPIFFFVITFNPSKVAVDHLFATLDKDKIKQFDNTQNNNLGYGGGANVAIREGLKKDFEWFVVMNQDLKITKTAIGEFSRKLEETEPGIAGPFAGRLDSKRWTTILNKENKDGFRLNGRNDNVNGYDNLRYISGAFMAIHRKVFEKVGLFYEPYFMYYEDADLSVRAKKAGFPLIQIKVKGISHEESTSLGRGSPAHEYYLARNHLLFIERNAPISIKLHEVLRMPKTLFEHFKNKNTGALRGICDFAMRKFSEIN